MSCINDTPHALLLAYVDHFLPGHQDTWSRDDAVNDGDNFVPSNPGKRTEKLPKADNDRCGSGWKIYGKIIDGGVWSDITEILCGPLNRAICRVY